VSLDVDTRRAIAIEEIVALANQKIEAMKQFAIAQVRAAYEDGVMAGAEREREACAVICDSLALPPEHVDPGESYTRGIHETATTAAAAIRFRGAR
jgi:hypothetical protein